MTGSGTVGKLENKNAGADPVSRSSACEQGNHDARPKVALLVDVENWAFWNISQQLVRHLSDRFEFRVIKAVAFNNLVQAVFAGVGCDVFHFFWREDARQLLSDHCRSYVEWMGIPYERFLDNVLRQFALSTCVYDHLAIEPEERALRRVVYTDLLDAYYVGSNRLATLYRESPGYPAPAAVLSDGVDRERFYRLNAERFDAVAHRPLVIGWVGNSAWGDGRADYKGVRTILLPAIERLQAEGFRVRADIVDRAAGRSVPHDQMVNYYRDIDLYICTSSVEGTPNPVLESMACGVPIVSTDVGIVPDAFGPQQREFILHERSVNAVVAAVKRLLETPALFRRLSDENIRAVEDWYWDQRVLGFADYFETCLQRRNQRLAGKT
jgi:glycosyltransferase involved in cell wall biosynthesis